MNTVARKNRYLPDEIPNCSVVQIHENEVTVFGRPIYNIRETEIDYGNNKALFFYKKDYGSLLQSPDASREDYEVVYFPLILALEIFKAFEEIDIENERRVNCLFT